MGEIQMLCIYHGKELRRDRDSLIPSKETREQFFSLRLRVLYVRGLSSSPNRKNNNVWYCKNAKKHRICIVGTCQMFVEVKQFRCRANT